MPAHHRGCHAERFGEFAGPAGPFGQQLDRLAPLRIRERGERAIECGGVGAHAQFFATMGTPIAASASERVTSRTCSENVHI